MNNTLITFILKKDGARHVGVLAANGLILSGDCGTIDPASGKIEDIRIIPGYLV